MQQSGYGQTRFSGVGPIHTGSCPDNSTNIYGYPVWDLSSIIMTGTKRYIESYQKNTMIVFTETDAGYFDIDGHCQDEYFLSSNRPGAFTNVSSSFIGCSSIIGGWSGKNMIATFDPATGYWGDVTVNFERNEQHMTYDRLGFEKGCSDNERQKLASQTFCIVQPTGQPLGTYSVWGGNEIKANESGELYVYFQWKAPDDYCNEVFIGGAMQVRLMKVNNVETSADEQDWFTHYETWQTLTVSGVTNQYWGTEFPLDKFGQYVFEVRVRDNRGHVYPASQQIIVNAVPECRNDPAPTSVLANPVEVVAPSASATDGGYVLNKDQVYSLQLYKPGEITNFSNYYDITDNAGNSLSSAVVLTSTGTDGMYNLKVTAAGSYSIYIKKKASLGCDQLNDGCNVPGFCQNFLPINIFVSGQNYSWTYDCLINLPADLFDPIKGPKIFPNIYSSNVTKTYLLKHFAYTVSSKKGIVIQPGQDYIHLTEGAHLVLLTPDPEAVSPETDDDDMNWVQNWSYDETGQIIGENKSFYNNNGKLLQTQYKNLTAGVVLANEIIYDRYGRTAIKTKPAPVRASTLSNSKNACGDDILAGQDLYFLYKSDFVTKSGSEYSYKNFDQYVENGATVNKQPSPDALDNTAPGSLGWYYSSNNRSDYSGLASDKSQDKLVESNVPTTSYPYSRMLYKSDGSGLTFGATLPGNKHHSGTKHILTNDLSSVTASDNSILDDYLDVYNLIFETSLTKNDLVVFKSWTNDMSYTDASGIEKDGGKDYVFFDADERELINYNDLTGDKSYSFYDGKGNIVCRVSPNGILQLEAGQDFANIDKILIKYNSRGQVIEVNEKDAGITKYMYRKDGLLRFSQNSKQLLSNTFSYINYDEIGRAIELGEFDPKSTAYLFNSTTLKGILEYGVSYSEMNIPGCNKNDVVFNFYDESVLSTQDSKYLTGKVSKTSRADNVSISTTGLVTVNTTTSTIYNYNSRGRLDWTIENSTLLGDKKISYKYTNSGQIKEMAYQPGDINEQFYHYYLYDKDGLLVSVQTGNVAPTYDFLNNSDKLLAGVQLKKEATYSYYLHGPLKSLTIEGVSQHVDYTYTPQGWLKSINTPTAQGIGNDMFAMQIDYFNDDNLEKANLSGVTGNQYYNGLIRDQFWNTTKPAIYSGADETNAYVFSYDTRKRLVNSEWGSVTNNLYTAAGNKYKEGGISYDANGNILNLKRYNATALLHDFSGDGSEDPLKATGYQYAINSNKLIRIYDKTKDATYATYNYDSRGQLVSQSISGKPVQNITYNSDGLIKEVKNGTQLLLRNFYDERGNRISKEEYLNDGTLFSTYYYVRDAGGNVLAVYNKIGAGQFQLKERSVYGAQRLGTIYVSSQTSVYDLTDHLGNIHARITNDGTPKVEAFTDYYPYGLEHDDNVFGSLVARNGYQSINSEKDNTEWNNFESRQYNSVIGRWNSIDKARQFASGYVGMGNIPNMAIDRDGNWVITVSMGFTAVVTPGAGELNIALAISGPGNYPTPAQLKAIMSTKVTATFTFAFGGGYSIGGASASTGMAINIYPSANSVSDILGYGINIGVINIPVIGGLEYNGSLNVDQFTQSKNPLDVRIPYSGVTVSPNGTGPDRLNMGGPAAYATLGYTSELGSFLPKDVIKSITDEFSFLNKKDIGNMMMQLFNAAFNAQRTAQQKVHIPSFIPSE